MEAGSGFENFTRKKASYFELLATIIQFKIYKQDINYRKSITVNERVVILFSTSFASIPMWKEISCYASFFLVWFLLYRGSQTVGRAP
jgi:hypothetical protein